MRYSKQREKIKNGLEKFCIHPTAEELYMNLKPANLNLSLATVYRNLNQLADIGEIKKIQGLSGQVHYDHNICEHYHLICVECNCIIDLPPEMGESMRNILKDIDEYKILSYDIIVKGLCKKCEAVRVKGQEDGI